jgi:hypothetical protein
LNGKKDEVTEIFVSSPAKTPHSSVILKSEATKNLLVPGSPEILRFTHNDNAVFPDGNELRFSLPVSKPLIRKRNRHASFELGFLKTNEVKLRSRATSLFDVQSSMFDVHFFSVPPEQEQPSA